MLKVGPAMKVTIHLNQDTGSSRGFLYDDILQFLQEKNIEGATAIHAQAGFGAHHRLHSRDAHDISADHFSVLIYFVDEASKVHAIMSDLLNMVTDGLVEAHPTEILKNITTSEKVLS